MTSKYVLNCLRMSRHRIKNQGWVTIIFCLVPVQSPLNQSLCFYCWLSALYCYTAASYTSLKSMMSPLSLNSHHSSLYHGLEPPHLLLSSPLHCTLATQASLIIPWTWQEHSQLRVLGLAFPSAINVAPPDSCILVSARMSHNYRGFPWHLY